jgi:hypothetical protein
MGQISVKTYAPNGSLLNDNQHTDNRILVIITFHPPRGRADPMGLRIANQANRHFGVNEKCRVAVALAGMRSLQPGLIRRIWSGEPPDVG